jgi:hypothetical protein
MADTLLLALLILGVFIFLIFLIVKGRKLPRKKIFVVLFISMIAIVSLFLYTGFDKIDSDISRLIHNSSPKSPLEIYALLFKKPLDSCATVLNLKDQVVPEIDCCIWMELNLCPKELSRIINLKKYEISHYNKSDSLIFLKLYGDRPVWWTPQSLSDSILKLTIKFNEDNQQTLFFGKDSSHVYLCDQAL